MTIEDVLKKKGHELFRELLRLYPTAEVEDYFKNGQWREDVMKIDLQLIDANRTEAGAADPPPLEEVVMPELPKTVPAVGGILLPGGTAAAKAAAAQSASTGPVAELRLIALFVAKWKLDPTRTKMILARMTPQRRRYVIQNFKTTVQGVEATTALETYIAECEKANAWGSLTAQATTVTAVAKPAAPVTARPVARPVMAVAGIKRPLGVTPPNPALDASKRPRVMAAMIQRPLTTARPQLATARPQFGVLSRPQGLAPPKAKATAPVAGAGAGAAVAAANAAGEKPGELIRNLLKRF